MFKLLLPSLLLVTGVLAVPRSSQAAVISSFLPEFSGPSLDTTSAYPQPPVSAGVFTYTIPAGARITGATVSSTFGNSSINSTALSNLFVAGVPVAACSSTNDPCYNPVNPFDNPAPWTYTFTNAQLASLAGGSANFTIVQTSAFQIQSGVAELDLTVAPAATPEPGTVALLVGGLAGLVLLRRKRAERK